MKSKEIINFVDGFSSMNYEKMESVLKILQNTMERKRIEDEIKHFDDARAKGATIDEISCYGTGGDNVGSYEDFKIRIRFPYEGKP